MDDAPAAAALSEPSPEMRSLSLLCHDLRQPLVVAVGYVSMLEEGSFGAMPEEALPILRTVAERLDAVNEIIDRLGAAPAPPQT